MLHACLCLVILGAGIEDPMPHARLRSVPGTRVTLQDSFWSPRLETNRVSSLPHVIQECENTGRIRNFAQTAGKEDSPFQGHIFHDSDVYKTMEGMAWSLLMRPDPILEAKLEAWVDLVKGSQQPDGYLNTYFTMKAPDKRWTNLPHDHELYCAGHLMEAAVAHHRATGRRTLLDVACRLADHIDTVFGPGKRHAVAGHPEIELALIKLWDSTGEERYLDLARFFVKEHGRSETHELFGTFCQDHMPVEEQREAVGHAVRWGYLFSAVADLAAIDGNPGYVEAMDALWKDIVEGKMYCTGGVGVQGHGEGFSEAYDLPNLGAYCETCASIAMIFWNHRMTLLHGQARFADLVETLLYNALLSGIALDGKTFFYVNPLESLGNHHRKSFYGCACCPTNVVRFLPLLGQYLYATAREDNALYVLQYVAGTASVHVGEMDVVVEQRTNYPWEEVVEIRVSPPSPVAFDLCLRVPSWCEKPSLFLNGEAVEFLERDGFTRIQRTWREGDRMTLRLPMPVRRIEAHPRVRDQAGKTAFAKGPVIYCWEDCDQEGKVCNMAVASDEVLKIETRQDLLGGVDVLKGQGHFHHMVQDPKGELAYETRYLDVMAVPYFAWDNRDPGGMVVWVSTSLPGPPSLDALTLAVLATSSASHCNESDTVRALQDAILPKSSMDHDIPRFTWWDHKGTEEWVMYTFEHPVILSRSEVYWFDDTGKGSCRVPQSWNLYLCDDQGRWRPVNTKDIFGTEKNTFNVVSFKSVTTTGIRLKARLQPEYSGGILEWRVVGP